LFVDFCVPRPGAAGCDSVSDPNAPTIPVSLTFQYGVIGTAFTSGFFADAALALSGSVVDTERGGYVAIEDLLRNSLSSHGIQFAPIAVYGIPIPLPNQTDATITQPVTFSFFVKRGRIYRFQLSAAARANGEGFVDAFRTNCDSFVISGCVQQGLTLSNLTVEVDQDLEGDLLNQLTNLEDVVSALQDQIGQLMKRIDALETQVQEIVPRLTGEGKDKAR
jgi:hypothetical protein